MNRKNARDTHANSATQRRSARGITCSSSFRPDVNSHRRGKRAHLQLQLEQRHRSQVVNAQQSLQKQGAEVGPACVIEQRAVARARGVLAVHQQRHRALELREVSGRELAQMLARISERGARVSPLDQLHVLLHVQPEEEAALDLA